MGRLGLLQCREKCINDGAEGKMARCVRQRNFPLNKRCLCQLRRAPMKRVDGGSRQSPRYHVHKKSYGPRNSSADFNWAQVAAQQKTAIEQEIVKNAVLADDNGPISLFLDVYPTEGIDVRICINSLSKCQTQLITPKSWNRVRAKIKVKKAERVSSSFVYGLFSSRK
ncbi:unnamed protein product [Nippostrongylus brasiliensis]|uniref:NFACT-R_1 domain-containing protein n=1 Tax=Nippostrongylus brasiliensis TaxID=27835 RepID=A0A158R119_NIPBR|nr:unnamed protein product [Nippostrongylus brasiliensis]